MIFSSFKNIFVSEVFVDYVFHLVFTKNIHENSVGKSFESALKWYQGIMCVNIYIHLPVNAIVRLPYPQSRDKQTCSYDTECSNHHPSLSTLRPKGLSCSMMKW